MARIGTTNRRASTPESGRTDATVHQDCEPEPPDASFCRSARSVGDDRIWSWPRWPTLKHVLRPSKPTGRTTARCWRRSGRSGSASTDVARKSTTSVAGIDQRLSDVAVTTNANREAINALGEKLAADQADTREQFSALRNALVDHRQETRAGFRAVDDQLADIKDLIVDGLGGRDQ